MSYLNHVSELMKLPIQLRTNWNREVIFGQQDIPLQNVKRAQEGEVILGLVAKFTSEAVGVKCGDMPVSFILKHSCHVKYPKPTIRFRKNYRR